MSSKSRLVHATYVQAMASNYSQKQRSFPKIKRQWHGDSGAARESDTYAIHALPLSNTLLQTSQSFPEFPAEDYSDSEGENSHISGTDDLAVTGSENLSLPGRTCSEASSTPLPSGEGTEMAQSVSNYRADGVDFDFAPAAEADKQGQQIDDFNFRYTPTAEYLEERELDFKELLRKERNRAAAQRSNLRKKNEKEARKRELSSLQVRERRLRVKELELRQQNRRLRELVYKSGQQLPTIVFPR